MTKNKNQNNKINRYKKGLKLQKWIKKRNTYQNNKLKRLKRLKRLKGLKGLRNPKKHRVLKCLRTFCLKIYF